MNGLYSNSYLVFGDCKRVAEELHEERASPVGVRRLFSQFITLSQQLTEVMRKEYSGNCNAKWVAQSYSGWTDVTSLFKKLRRTDYHEYPVTIFVEETQYFDIGDVFEDGVGDSEVAIQGRWELGDPFSKSPPNGIKLILADPVTGKPSDKSVNPKRRRYQFILNARTPELEKAIALAGTNDVHELVGRCFSSLSEYYAYYRHETSAHRA